MVTLFIAHTRANAECVAQLQQDFNVCGYAVWQEPISIIKLATSRRTIDNAILSSAAVVLLWSTDTAQAESVKQDIHVAQVLKKLIFPVIIDATPLPTSLISLSPTSGQPLCEKVVATLMTLPNFPPSQSTDPLIKLYKLAGSNIVRERETAIDQASEMHQKGELVDEIFALLQYLARTDTMAMLRERARKAFNNSDDPRHFFKVRCEKGHVSQFDKRCDCNANKAIYRKTNGSIEELDELHLKCKTPGCNVEVVAFVDCQDYRNTK